MIRSKYVVLLFLSTTCMVWSQNLLSLSDTTKVNEVFLNTPLIEALEVLNTKYGVLVAYDQTDIADLYVHRFIENMNVHEALEDILDNSGLEYQFLSDEEVLIRRLNSDEPDLSLTIEGLIVSEDTQRPLSWATVYDSASRRAAYTDDQGRFKLKLLDPPPSGMLKIQYLGYKDKLAVWSDKERSLFVALEAEPYQLNEIVIVDFIPVVQTEVTTDGFDRKVNLNRLALGAGGIKDELQTLKFLPGISATNDLSSGLQVRGGDENESLYHLDGIEFFNIDHFFGIFSAFDASTIDSTHVYLSNFPMKFGGRTSGVVDMYLKKPAGAELNGQLGLHTLYSHFNIERKVTQNSGVMFSTRFTNGDISDTDIYDVLFDNSSMHNGGNTINENRNALFEVVPFFRFQDAQLKWQWNPTPSSSLSATLFSGRDQSITEYSLAYRRRVDSIPSTITEDYDERIVWDNRGFNVSFDHRPSSRWYYEIDFSVSEYNLNRRIDTKLKVENPLRRDSLILLNKSSNGVLGGSLRWNNQISVFESHKVTAGIELENHQTAVLSETESTELLNYRDTAINVNLFASYLFPISKNMDFKLGVRTSGYSGTNRSYLSPRTSLTYRLTNAWEISMSGGVYNQFLRNLNYEDRFGKSHQLWLLANDDVRVLKSNHFNLSSSYTTGELFFKLDFFRKKSIHEIEQLWVVNGFDPQTQKPRSSKFERFFGDGNSIGFSLYGQYHRGWYDGQLGYTWQKNTLSIDDIDNGNPFPASNDRRHELSLFNQFKIGDWSIGNTWIYGSGLPFVSALLIQNRDIRDLSVGERIDRMKDYFRIDLAVSYEFMLWNQEFHAGVSVFNVLNRSNSDQVQYLYSLPEDKTAPGQVDEYVVGSDIQLLPRTVDISFEWHF